MKKVTITHKAVNTYHLEYDPESPEFKAALATYQEVIEQGGGEVEMLQHIAYCASEFGESNILEIGFLARLGKPLGEPYCGVNIIRGTETDIEFEIKEVKS